LENSTQVTLYSLEPWAGYDEKTGARYHKNLGRVVLDRTQAAKAIADLRSAITGGVQCSGFLWRRCIRTAAPCFNPRHALDIVANGKNFYFLICYECRQVQIYENGRPLAGLTIAGSQKVLNGLLVAANVPVSRSGEQGAGKP
jgi:hypothetical protein